MGCLKTKFLNLLCKALKNNVLEFTVNIVGRLRNKILEFRVLFLGQRAENTALIMNR